MGYQHGVQENQQAINEFRERLTDIIRDTDTDLYLLKWLKARQFNFKNAEQMFRESREYLDKIDVNYIREEYVVPEVLQKYLPGALLGFDKEGSPIKVELFGLLDMKGIMYSAKKSDLEKTKIVQCERTVDLWNSQSKKLGKTVDGITVVFDMEHVSMKCLWRPGLQMYLYLVSVLENNYPEMMKQLFVINTPSIFPLLFKVARPLMSEDTRNKIHVLGSDYKSHLLKHIDADQLPAFLGGTMVDPVDGGDRCSSLICQGGEVPRSFYLNENSDLSNLEKKDINKGGEFVMEFDVEFPGSVLKWEFRTEDHDIGFGVFRKIPNKKKDEAIVESKRINCNIMTEEGSVVCDKSATYKIRFDNSYSWTRGKTLLYLVELFTNDEVNDLHVDKDAGGSWTRFVDNKQITHL